MSIAGINGNTTADYIRSAHAHTESALAAKQKGRVLSDTPPQRSPDDRVTISEQARAMLNLTKDELSSNQTGTVLPREISFTQDDLREVKEKFKALQKAKMDIDSDIDTILRKNDIRLDAGDILKIELDSGGNIIVGGVSDAKKAKAIESALNKDDDLAKKIKSHRDHERSVSAELKDITGMSIQDFRRRLSSIQYDTLEEKPFKNHGEFYTKDELMSFMDQDLHWVDPDFMDEIGKYIQSDSQYAISPGNDILSNPAGIMNKTVTDIRDRLVKAFKAANLELREIYNLDDSNPDDKELIDKMEMSLDGVTIRIDAEGNVIIEGDVAEDRAMDRKGKALIKSMISETIRKNPITGEKHNYQIASERLMNLYEDEFGVPSCDEKMVTTITNGRVTSQVYSPKKQAGLQDEIQTEVNNAVREMGGTLQEDLEIEIDDKGKITATNLPDDEKDKQALLAILKRLNFDLERADGKNADPDDHSKEGIVTRLKSKINQLAVFSEGGALKINKSYSVTMDEHEPA